MTHSFPTLRSADLVAALGRKWHRRHALRRDGELAFKGPRCARARAAVRAQSAGRSARIIACRTRRVSDLSPVRRGRASAFAGALPGRGPSRRRSDPFGRSEEHTSELQSLMRNSYAVFCLKKKNKDTQINKNHNN